MRVTPLDIRQTEFAVRFRGYDPIAVQQLMQMAAGELERMIRENQGLRQELHDTVQKLSEMREKELLLKETLMEAQRTRQTVEDAARKEAELVIADAEMRARELLGETHRELNEMRRNISELRNEKIRIRHEMQSAVKTFNHLLEADEEADRRRAPDDSRLHFLEPPVEREAQG